jgi:hypothetical protein
MQDYPCVWAWGKIMGADRESIEREVEMARADKAPADATFKRKDGEWSRYGDVTSVHTRNLLDRMLEGDRAAL